MTGALLKIGVPYEAALDMPLCFALAMLSGVRPDNTRHNPSFNDAAPPGMVLKVATRRKSKGG